MPAQPFLQRVLRRRRSNTPASTRPDLTGIPEEDRPIVERVLPYTMTGAQRVIALIEAVRYCTRRDVPGAFVECGVWRGGSVLAMLLALQALGRDDRDIYLYDTFEGMTEPTEHDVSLLGERALETWRQARRRGERGWNEFFSAEAFGEEAVRATLLSTGYPSERMRFVRGPVETTLPRSAPDRIALLRLDTDWFESTRHELVHLYPRLSSGGVLIVDDYGHWRGARRAVDEYFGEHGPAPLLAPIDYTGRLAVKA